jgi:hypothetical protein
MSSDLRAGDPLGAPGREADGSERPPKTNKKPRPDTMSKEHREAWTKLDRGPRY